MSHSKASRETAMRAHTRNRAIRRADEKEYADDLERRLGSRSVPDLILRRKVQMKDSPTEEIEF